jgi:hypothetical protein
MQNKKQWRFKPIQEDRKNAKNVFSNKNNNYTSQQASIHAFQSFC